MLPETFDTARLLLRPVAAVDVGAIFDTYAQDEEVTRYAIWRPHRSRSQTQAYVERCIATPADLERTYMLVGREDDVVRGAFDRLAANRSAMDWRGMVPRQAVGDDGFRPGGSEQDHFSALQCRQFGRFELGTDQPRPDRALDRRS